MHGHTATIIDHDVIEMIKDFEENAKYRNITVEQTEIEGKTWSMNSKSKTEQVGAN